MKIAYLLPFFFLAACNEDKLPPALILPQEDVLHMELSCDDCAIYWAVDAISGDAGILNTYVFDTTVANLEYSSIGFLDTTESLVEYHAIISLNGLILIDSIITPDTLDFGLVGGVSYDF